MCTASIEAGHTLTRQAEVLDLSRSSLYYRPRPVSAADLAIMRRIDEPHLAYPFLPAAGCCAICCVAKESRSGGAGSSR